MSHASFRFLFFALLGFFALLVMAAIADATDRRPKGWWHPTSKAATTHQVVPCAVCGTKVRLVVAHFPHGDSCTPFAEAGSCFCGCEPVHPDCCPVRHADVLAEAHA